MSAHRPADQRTRGQGWTDAPASLCGSFFRKLVQCLTDLSQGLHAHAIQHVTQQRIGLYQLSHPLFQCRADSAHPHQHLLCLGQQIGVRADHQRQVSSKMECLSLDFLHRPPGIRRLRLPQVRPQVNCFFERRSQNRPRAHSLGLQHFLGIDSDLYCR